MAAVRRGRDRGVVDLRQIELKGGDVHYGYELSAVDVCSGDHDAERNDVLTRSSFTFAAAARPAAWSGARGPSRAPRTWSTNSASTVSARQGDAVPGPISAVNENIAALRGWSLVGWFLVQRNLTGGDSLDQRPLVCQLQGSYVGKLVRLQPGHLFTGGVGVPAPGEYDGVLGTDRH